MTRTSQRICPTTFGNAFQAAAGSLEGAQGWPVRSLSRRLLFALQRTVCISFTERFTSACTRASSVRLIDGRVLHFSCCADVVSSRRASLLDQLFSFLGERRCSFC